MIKQFIKGKTAVFIDAANLELSAKDLHWRVDYRKLYKWLKKECDLIYIGFYTVRFGNNKHDAFLTVLKQAGYKLITKPLKLIKNRKEKNHIRKANFDVEIAVETMKRISSYDSFMLFSGDSDFAYLLQELRTNGKKIIIVSLKYHIARKLIQNADFYLDLRRIGNEIQRSNRK